jgi:malonyl-CoA O-methyltransferase
MEHVNVQDAYTSWSKSYDLDRNLTRDLDRAVTTETFAGRRYHAILEVGCGTGKNTTLLAEIGERVCALDFSIGMLKQAQGKLRSDHVVFAVADLTKPWPCKTESVELILCNLVLEHIQDLTVIFSEACRTLAPGGQFFISELHPFRQYQGTRANFQRQEETIEIQAFVHHLSDFAEAAAKNGLALQSFKERWHEADENKLPRLIVLMFEKRIEESNEQRHAFRDEVSAAR